jgi:superfamily I DNA and RNA helicase
MNEYLENIPEECSQLHKYLPIAQSIWKSLMEKVFHDSTDEDDNPNFAMRVEVDLVQDEKSTHPIVKEILYTKAKEQYLAGHGFGFGFYSKRDSNFETMICFYETQITNIKYVEIVC